MCSGEAFRQEAVVQRFLFIPFALFNPIVQVFWECKVPLGEGDEPRRLRVPLHISALLTEKILARPVRRVIEASVSETIRFEG